MKIVLPRGEKDEILKDAAEGNKYAARIIADYKELVIYQNDPDWMKRFEDALETWRYKKKQLKMGGGHV